MGDRLLVRAGSRLLGLIQLHEAGADMGHGLLRLCGTSLRRGLLLRPLAGGGRLLRPAGAGPVGEVDDGGASGGLRLCQRTIDPRERAQERLLFFPPRRLRRERFLSFARHTTIFAIQVSRYLLVSMSIQKSNLSTVHTYCHTPHSQGHWPSGAETAGHGQRSHCHSANALSASMWVLWKDLGWSEASGTGPGLRPRFVPWTLALG